MQPVNRKRPRSEPAGGRGVAAVAVRRVGQPLEQESLAAHHPHRRVGLSGDDLSQRFGTCDVVGGANVGYASMYRTGRGATDMVVVARSDHYVKRMMSVRMLNTKCAAF